LIVLYGISVGMMILHRHQIMHRDLKPANILLNDDFEPKIADFGCAKIFDVSQSLGQTARRGTPLYMAPEILSERDYNFSVDVYSYGILVYATVSGKEPYPSAALASGYAFETRVIEGLRPTILPNLKKWRNLMETCWDGNPSNRPSFEKICVRLAGRDFVSDLDRKGATRFLEYRNRVTPNFVAL
jgi:serine/threonine protein kinase